MTDLRVLSKPEELVQVEALQRLVWPGDETGIVPVHMLRAVADHGGVVIGAFEGDQLIGFVFGFPGIDETPAGPCLVHASHMAGIHPDYRDHGLGFMLKRAQWQIVRQQKIERICWTYDPLQSRNANLNIAKLGAVCNTYTPEYYGEMHDGLNTGLPSDRFTVDWWVNTSRVRQRLSLTGRGKLNLTHFQAAHTEIVNPVLQWADKFPIPVVEFALYSEKENAILLVEIPADFQTMCVSNVELALQWRLHTRRIFQTYFSLGYFVTDFVFEPGELPRSYYVLGYGESTF